MTVFNSSQKIGMEWVMIGWHHAMLIVLIDALHQVMRYYSKITQNYLNSSNYNTLFIILRLFAPFYLIIMVTPASQCLEYIKIWHINITYLMQKLSAEFLWLPIFDGLSTNLLRSSLFNSYPKYQCFQSNSQEFIKMLKRRWWKRRRPL